MKTIEEVLDGLLGLEDMLDYAWPCISDTVDLLQDLDRYMSVLDMLGFGMDDIADNFALIKELVRRDYKKVWTLPDYHNFASESKDSFFMIYLHNTYLMVLE